MRRLSFLSLCLDLVVTTIATFVFVARTLLIHKKSKILFVFYNLMIDTTLPGILVQKLFCFLPFVDIKLFLEVEENIVVDSVSKPWRLYSTAIADYVQFDMVLTVTSRAANGIKSKTPLIISPGIYCPDNRNSFANLELKPRNIINVLFSSRIDSQRGMFDFLDLLVNLSAETIDEIV